MRKDKILKKIIDIDAKIVKLSDKMDNECKERKITCPLYLLAGIILLFISMILHSLYVIIDKLYKETFAYRYLLWKRNKLYYVSISRSSINIEEIGTNKYMYYNWEKDECSWNFLIECDMIAVDCCDEILDLMQEVFIDAEVIAEKKLKF